VETRFNSANVDPVEPNRRPMPGDQRSAPIPP